MGSFESSGSRVASLGRFGGLGGDGLDVHDRNWMLEKD